MRKFKVLKGFSIFFGIFTILGLLGLVITYNPDMILSFRDIAVEACNKIGITTMEQLQNYLMITTSILFWLCSIFTWSAFGAAKKAIKSSRSASKRQTVTEVRINTESDIKEMQRQQHREEVNMLKRKEKAEKVEKKEKVKKAKEVAKKEVKKEATEVVTEVKKEANNKFDDILNSLK